MISGIQQMLLRFFMKFFCGFCCLMILFVQVSCGKKESKKKPSDINGLKKHAFSGKKKNSKKKLPSKCVSEKKSELKKMQLKNNSSELILTQLFHTPKGEKIPSRVQKPVSLKEFAAVILKETPQLTEKEFSVIKNSVLQNREIDSGQLGLYLYSAEKPGRISELGYALIMQSCIEKTRFFRPEEFFVAFAQLGFNAEPYLNRILFQTRSDFIRAWAAELYVEIFYHNADKTDGRYRKLAKVIESEKVILQKIKTVFSKPENVKNILKSESIGRQIRKSIGPENRYSLKMLQIMKLLDNLNKKNLFAVSKKIPEIIGSNSYDYNLFDYLNRKIVLDKAIPSKVQVKYLADAVFGDDIQDTYHWIPKENGGFSRKELMDAFNSDDSENLKQMINIFKEIICTVLKGKLLLGQGQKELNLLHKFYYGTWEKNEIQWNDSMIIIDNHTGVSLSLVLQKKMKPADILTGAEIIKTDKHIEDRDVKFLIPPFSSFVWFAPDGKFIISSDNQIPDVTNTAGFQSREFVLSSVMHISID